MGVKMKKKPVKKNKLFYFAFFIFVLSISLFLVTLYIKSAVVLEKKEIIATLRVGDIAGFDANATALTFGTITSGSRSYRDLTIENNYGFPIKVEFRAKGNITKFLLFDKMVYLDVGEKKSIKIDTIVPVDEKYSDYSGKIVVVMKRTWNN